MDLKFRFISIIIISLFKNVTAPCVNCRCPEDDGDALVRITGTRFYMLNQESDKCNYKDAEKKCVELGLDLARINSIEEDYTIGRWLENWAVKNNIKSTYWWIDAHFDRAKDIYVYLNGDPLEYQNFIFKTFPVAGNPGDWIEYNITGGGNNRTNTSSSCATIALPFNYHSLLGMQYSWIETDCELKKQVLCQADKKCDTFANKWQLEHKRYEGWFPLSARKYLVKWDRLTKADAIEACSSINLIAYDVHETQDFCILNLIKRHRREVTHTSFWTGWTYNQVDREFFDPHGNQRGSFGIRIQDVRASGPRSKTEPYCVALLYAFEHQNSCNCPWKYIQTIPSHCEVVNGVICQHTLHKKLPCVYDLIFPLKENSNTFRSDDKADYPTAEVECRRYGLTLTDFKYVEDIAFEHEYDKQVQYWVYSDQADDESCKTAEWKEVSGHWKWVYTNEDCKLLKFYLCAKNKGSSSQSGRSMASFSSQNNDAIPFTKSDQHDRHRQKYAGFEPMEYVLGEKTTFKRSKHHCHQKGMELLSADDPDQVEFLESTAARLNSTFWIYSKHVDRAKRYRHHEEDRKRGFHHVCTTMNQYGVPKASNCKHRHRYICTYKNK